MIVIIFFMRFDTYITCCKVKSDRLYVIMGNM